MAEIFKKAILSTELAYLKTPAVVPTLNVVQNHTEKELTVDSALLKEQAYQSGFDSGLATAQNQMEEQIKQINDLLANIPQAVQQTRHQLSTEIADIVLLIIKQFFINQQHNKDAIAAQINQTIAQLNDKQNIELSLNPQDLALLKTGELKLELKQCKNLRIIPDEQLRLGGCLIKSEHGLFDAGIERQIDSLKQVLLQIKQGDSCE